MQLMLKLAFIACSLQAPIFASYQPLSQEEQVDAALLRMRTALPCLVQNQPRRTLIMRTLAVIAALSVATYFGITHSNTNTNSDSNPDIPLNVPYQVKVSGCSSCYGDRYSSPLCAYKVYHNPPITAQSVTIEIQKLINGPCTQYFDHGEKKVSPATIELIPMPEHTPCYLYNEKVPGEVEDCRASGWKAQDDEDMTNHCYVARGLCGCPTQDRPIDFAIEAPICPTPNSTFSVYTSQLKQIIKDSLSPYMSCWNDNLAIRKYPCKASTSGQCQSVENALKPVKNLCNNNNGNSATAQFRGISNKTQSVKSDPNWRRKLIARNKHKKFTK